VRPVFDEPDPGVHYYSFAVPGVIELGAVLRHVDHGPYDMMLSFDSLSVYARNIECFPRTLHCTATGDARIEIGQEDGVHRDRAARIEIDLPKRAASLYGDESSRELKF
jgi:hypothetical protein